MLVEGFARFASCRAVLRAAECPAGLRRPRAFTLIELIAVMGVTALITLIATSMLFSVVQQHSAMRKQLLIGNSQRRLSVAFRRDVQQARTLESTQSTITLVGPRGRVTYSQVVPSTIRRTVGVGDSRRSDDFDLLSLHVLRFTVQQIGDRKVVSLVITQPQAPQETASPPAPYAVSRVGLTTVAELGRDHRWNAQEDSAMSRLASQRQARSGISILLVVICLMVIMATVGAMLRSLVLVNRQSKQHMRASQAAWLADSGLQRAAYRFAQDADYRGESWIVSEKLLAPQIGHVEIRIVENSGNANLVTARVVATFPHESTFAVKARREAMITTKGAVARQPEGGDDQDAVP